MDRSTIEQSAIGVTAAGDLQSRESAPQQASAFNRTVTAVKESLKPLLIGLKPVLTGLASAGVASGFGLGLPVSLFVGAGVGVFSYLYSGKSAVDAAGGENIAASRAGETITHPEAGLDAGLELDLSTQKEDTSIDTQIETQSVSSRDSGLGLNDEAPESLTFSEDGSFGSTELGFDFDLTEEDAKEMRLFGYEVKDGKASPISSEETTAFEFDKELEGPDADPIGNDQESEEEKEYNELLKEKQAEAEFDKEVRRLMAIDMSVESIQVEEKGNGFNSVNGSAVNNHFMPVAQGEAVSQISGQEEIDDEVAEQEKISREIDECQKRLDELRKQQKTQKKLYKQASSNSSTMEVQSQIDQNKSKRKAVVDWLDEAKSSVSELEEQRDVFSSLEDLQNAKAHLDSINAKLPEDGKMTFDVFLNEADKKIVEVTEKLEQLKQLIAEEEEKRACLDKTIEGNEKLLNVIRESNYQQEDECAKADFYLQEAMTKEKQAIAALQRQKSKLEDK